VFAAETVDFLPLLFCTLETNAEIDYDFPIHEIFTLEMNIGFRVSKYYNRHSTYDGCIFLALAFYLKSPYPTSD